jgi:dihydroxyacid dehydratase/phosphogluconate dehydratase
MTPEAVDGGAIAKIRDGDMIRLDANEGTLTFLGDEKEFFSRTPATEDLRASITAWAANSSPASAALVGPDQFRGARATSPKGSALGPAADRGDPFPAPRAKL